MPNKTIRYFIAGQICLYTSILICVLISPEALFANDGISYYSAQKETIIPYSLGLLATAWFSYKVAKNLKEYVFMRWGFNAIAFFLIVTVVVPYGISYALALSHTMLSIALFLVQFLFALKLATSVNRDILSFILITLLVINSVITIRYLSPKMGFLLQGEVMFQVLFTLIAYRAVKSVSKTAHTENFLKVGRAPEAAST